jgi:GNAT superfamily N-acetyltransferase
VTDALQIRRALPGDVERIAAAHRASILALGPAAYPPDVVRDWAAGVRPDRYLEMMAWGACSFFVAEESSDAEVLGFGSHGFIDGLHRTAVYVRGTAVRRGIGSRLFRYAEAAAIEAGASTLHLDASLVAVEFWRAMGFHEVRREDHRLRTGPAMACVVMRKDLVRGERG